MIIIISKKINILCELYTMIITETKNDLPNMNPIKERMDIYIPKINENLPRRNGFVYALIGAGGSGKSSLMLSMFKSPQYYRCKFDNIFYFTPASSFLSVEKHPFSSHDKVYHDLEPATLETIYDELLTLKEDALINNCPLEHSLIVIDDFANDLKDKVLSQKINQAIVKTRHLNCCWIFTLQSYTLLPRVLRKKITNATIFKPNNNEEWDSINQELLNMSKKNLISLYDYCFDKPYTHLDIDTKENKLYKNFNKLNLTH
jgi:ABC-type dipeptide/oligopeptide/nickel transport system ATPase component